MIVRRRARFVSKIIYVDHDTNNNLLRIGKDEGKTQQVLINEMIDEGIARRLNNECANSSTS